MLTKTTWTAFVLLITLSPLGAMGGPPESGVDAEGFIRNWLVLAPVPFPREPTGKVQIRARHLANEATLRPVAGQAARVSDRELLWQEHQAPEAAIDFVRHVDPGRSLEAFGYAVAYLVADAPGEVTARLGSSDQVQVYLGGKPVFASERTRDYRADEDTIRLRLMKGVNPVVLKVVNAGGSWKASLRLLDASGQPARGVRAAVHPRLDPSDMFPLDEQGYVRSWLLLAPISYIPPVVGKGELARQQVPGEARLRPREGERVQTGERELTWRAVRSEQRALDLAAVVSPAKVDAVVGYAVAYVLSPEAKTGLKLKMGSNDQARVYVNGKALVAFDAPRAFRADQDVVAGVSLKKGLNVIVFKILNTERRWEGSLRFTDATDRPVTDLRAVLAPSDS